MADYRLKLRFLFLPVVFCSLATIVGYLALYALLVEWTGWIVADGELQEFWLPFIVGSVALIAVIGPRSRIFEKTGTRDPYNLIFVPAIVMIVLPLMMLQFSVQEAMWGLRTIPTLNDIPIASQARFYVTPGDCVNLPATRWHRYAHNDGRHNDIELELYAAVPVCTAGASPTRWIGVHRSHTISGSRDRREAEANAFEQQLRSDVQSLDALRFTYYERVRDGAERHQFDKAIGKSDPASVIVMPSQDAFGARTTDRVIWSAIAYGIGAAGLAVLLLFWELDPDEAESVRQTGRLTVKPKETVTGWLLVIPSREIYGPAVLIDAIIGVFGAMVFSGLGMMSFPDDDLLAWGASHGPLGFGPDHHGLVTAMFLHGGLWHMLNNLYGLVFAVACLLPVARNMRLIGCFLICGVAGSMASVWWHPQAIGVGASGAVLGLWGVAVALAALRDRRIAGNEKFILVNIAIYGVMTGVQGLLSSNIDNAAHIGGFATGLVLGVGLFGWQKIFPDADDDESGHRALLINIFKPDGDRT